MIVAQGWVSTHCDGTMETGSVQGNCLVFSFPVLALGFKVYMNNTITTVWKDKVVCVISIRMEMTNFRTERNAAACHIVGG